MVEYFVKSNKHGKLNVSYNFKNFKDITCKTSTLKNLYLPFYFENSQYCNKKKQSCLKTCIVNKNCFCNLKKKPFLFENDWIPFSQSKAPQAPNNTTQFLITDREERESSDRDIICDKITVSTPATPSHQFDYYPETFDSLQKQFHTKNMASCTCNFALPDSNKYIDDENTENPEFTAVYDDFNFERIKRMSRDEVCF